MITINYYKGVNEMIKIHKLHYRSAAILIIAWMGILNNVHAEKIPATTQSSQPSNDKIAVTNHSTTIGDQEIDYTATAGYLTLKDNADKPQANIFFVAYEKSDPKNKQNRPLAFAFNGGPGASSIWLHLGAMGPKFVSFPNDGKSLPAHPSLEPNNESWLEFTDMVFIDPVSAGFSRSAPGVDAKNFHNVQNDIESIAKFIQLYLSRYDRWLSPIYLVGESYGTTRAAGLADYLQDSLGIYPSGMVMISPVLDFQTILYSRDNDLAYALNVPTFTATAFYHKKLSPELQKDFAKTLAESENWALNDYWLALAKGDALDDPHRTQIAEKMSQLTGLDKNFILLNNLRVGNQQYIKELLRNEGKLIGLMDARVVAYDTDQAGDYASYDPAFFLSIGPLNMAMNSYVRDELGYASDLPYEYLSRQANREWNLDDEGRGFLSTAPRLKEAMTKNSNLRVFFADGYYDQTTPYFANLYMVNHLGLAKELRKNVAVKYYFSGHQLYTDPATRKKLYQDAQSFFQGK
jgi:carboxypeptidase C (cathepsin A)